MKKLLTGVLAAGLLVLACGRTAPKQADVDFAEAMGIPACVITTPPDSLGLDPWYKKYVDVYSGRICSDEEAGICDRRERCGAAGG